MTSPFSPLTLGLMHAVRLIEAQMEDVLSEMGLSIPKLTVLHHLAGSGEPISLSQLAGRCSCVRSNMTQLIDRLEADGWVRRIQDPRDRRSVQAGVTERGREIYQAGLRRMREAEAGILAQWSPEQQKVLQQLLHQCTGEVVVSR